MPPVFTSILCPVDFSPHAERALIHAAALARLSGARLLVTTIVDPLLAAAADAALPNESFNAQTRHELDEFVRSAMARCEGPEATISVVVGEPAPSILQEAARVGADVIVMGTKGLSGAKRMVFGSTTEGVLRDSKLPVLAVPPSDGDD